MEKAMKPEAIIVKVKLPICILLIFIILLMTSYFMMSCSKPADANSLTDESAEAVPENNASEISPENNTDISDVQTTTKAPLNLPDAKYDGYEFKVMNIDQSAMTWVFTNIYAEEQTGDGINDAVYIRNRLVEDRFDISIKEIKGSSDGDIYQKASKSIKAGSNDYDLILLASNSAVNLAKSHLLLDYNDIPYVDLTQPWWDRDMVRDLSVAKHNYLVTGDFSMMHYDDTVAMFFNKKLLKDMGLESPYDVVHDGKWTFDKFWSMAKNASLDLDGNGKFDEKDQYGYMSLTHIWSESFMAAADQKMISKDANDMHVFAMNNEKFIQAYQKMIEIMHDGNMVFDADTAGNHRLQDIMFPNNQALFWSEVVHWGTILRNMDADFGIIIHPKWDENQTDYLNYVFPPPVMCVPTTTSDIEREGMILEALCYESTDTVIKAYYDVLLKTKVSRDDESEKMLDIMFKHRSYDASGTFYNSEIYSQYTGALSKNANADLVSWIDKNQSKIDKAIEKINQAFSEEAN